MNPWAKRFANLLSIKSIVTVTLTTVFAKLALSGQVSVEQFMTVFTVVIAFYFGTQSEKRTHEADDLAAKKGSTDKTENPS